MPKGDDNPPHEAAAPPPRQPAIVPIYIDNMLDDHRRRLVIPKRFHKEVYMLNLAELHRLSLQALRQKLATDVKTVCENSPTLEHADSIFRHMRDYCKQTLH